MKCGIAQGLFPSVRRQLGLLGMTILVALAGGCSDKPAQPGASSQAPPAKVPIVEVAPQTVTVNRVYPARAQAADDVEVRAQVQGILLRRSYEEGARVKAGELLFQIDPAPYQARVQQAEAELERARAQLRQAQREWNRVSALYEENAVSQRQRDEAQSSLELAQAAVSNAEAALRTARIDLGYTRVTAPIDGVTGLREVSEGNLIEAGALLTTIRQLDPIHVLFSLPEADAIAQRRQLGLIGAAPAPEQRLQARALLPDGSRYEPEGVIDFVAANVDPQTGTVQARAVFPNPQGTLVPGQFLRISVQGLKLPNVIVVPAEAVAEGPQGPIVYVVDAQNVAQPRSVTLGQQLEQGQVVAAGLQGGERVIAGALASVRPGQAVQPVPAAQGSAERGTGSQAGRPADAAETRR